ncbi:MAG: Chromate transport protein ChrA [Symbiobacteriaceae bacterium]|jgi:chromate transporter|nr:Chromate transport protein ChrA [Symbiobacteriaceae bacterium]
MTLARLFLLVASLNAMALGGGGMMLAGLERELVGGGWITPGDFAAGVALGQSTPGPLAAFTTAIGRAALGLPGALVATAGLVVVSLGAVWVMGWVPLAWFRQARVQGAVALVPPYVTALVLFLALRMVLAGEATRPWLPILVVAGVVIGRVKKVPTPALMLGALGLGMALQEAW